MTGRRTVLVGVGVGVSVAVGVLVGVAVPAGVGVFSRPTTVLGQPRTPNVLT